MSTGVPPIVDTANTLLAQVPSRLESGTVKMADGTELAVLTIRTASTTLTILLGSEDLAKWEGVITGLSRRMSSPGLHVPSAAETFSVLDANGHPRKR